MNNYTEINTENAEFAQQQLLRWFRTSARTFPWRYDTNPYHVLIAEMMLRRTQARQVVPVYSKFIKRYPDIESLDAAPVEEVASLLYPLGLSWRVNNFKMLAREILVRHQGIVPRERDALLALTGVGSYVADAVRCFAFNEIAVIMDTNTVRIAARYFGFDYNPESRRRKPVIAAVSRLVNHQEPAKSNYALLDIAATVCRARDPIHEQCPLASQCAFYRALQQTTDK